MPTRKENKNCEFQYKYIIYQENHIRNRMIQQKFYYLILCFSKFACEKKNEEEEERSSPEHITGFCFSLYSSLNLD